MVYSVFDSTNPCEKTFSKVNYLKSHYQSALTEEHL